MKLKSLITICFLLFCVKATYSQELKVYKDENAVRMDGSRYVAYGYKDYYGEVVIYAKYDRAYEFSDGLAAVRQQDRWGYINKDGKVIIPFDYTEVNNFNDGIAAVRRGSKWGIIDKTGEKIVPFILDYPDVRVFSEGFAVVTNNGKKGFIDKTGKEIVSCKYYDVKNFSDGLAAVDKGSYRGSKWGYIDTNGKEIIKEKYPEVKSFNNGLAEVRLGSKWGIINKNGIETTKFNYYEIERLNNGLLAVNTNDYRKPDCWGFVNESGQEIVKPKYYKYDILSEGYILVKAKEKDKWGLIDKSGAEILKPIFNSVSKFNFVYNIAQVSIQDKGGTKVGYIDGKGNYVIPPIYDYFLSDVDSGVVVAKKDGKYGVIDLKSNEIFPFGDRKIFRVVGQIYGLESDTKWKGNLGQYIGENDIKSWRDSVRVANSKHVILYKGKNRIGEYDQVILQKDAILTIDNNKIGAVTLNGKEIMPPITEFIGSLITKKGEILNNEKTNMFSELTEDAVYKIDGKCGLIDKNGTIIIDATSEKAYDELGYILNLGLRKAKKDNKWGYIDQYAKVKIPLIYEEADNFHGYYAAVKKINGKYGFIDNTGKEVLPFIYDKAYSFSAPWNENKLLFPTYTANVILNGKSELLDASGKIISANKPTSSQNQGSYFINMPTKASDFSQVRYFNQQTFGAGAGYIQEANTKVELSSTSIIEYTLGNNDIWVQMSEREVEKYGYSIQGGVKGMLYITTSGYFYFLFSNFNGDGLYISNPSGSSVRIYSNFEE